MLQFADETLAVTNVSLGNGQKEKFWTESWLSNACPFINYVGADTTVTNKKGSVVEFIHNH